MNDIAQRLGSVVSKLSDQNYEQSLASYRLWFGIGRTYFRIPSDKIFEAIWDNRGCSEVEPEKGKFFHPTAQLILCFASDVESDPTLGPYSAGLRRRLFTEILRNFFEINVAYMNHKDLSDEIEERGRKDGVYYHVGGAANEQRRQFAVDSNLIARWANSGCLEEVEIRDHILQSLISHHKLYDHQADAIIILFKIAGATFGAYADPSAVDRCFELLEGHYSRKSVKSRLEQVRAPCDEMQH